MPTFHLLTGEYPPETGGVGDYTSLVAEGLAARGASVHVWCPNAIASDAGGGAVHVHQLPDTFGPASRRHLEMAFLARPGCVLLEYVPNALGARGANVAFCAWLLRLRRRGADVRVMFHEPYFYFSWQRPWRNGLAVVQRLMAALLVRASSVAYVSTLAWRDCLSPLGPSAMVESPIPATIATEASLDAIATWRSRFLAAHPGALVVGHFGTFGDHVGRELMRIVPRILDAVPSACVVCIGRGGEAFVAGIARENPALGNRASATGMLSRSDVSAALRACDLVVQPFPDGVTTRRTTVMAALANGVAVVTTDGVLTEPTWRQSGAVRLAPASDPDAVAAAAAALLTDPVETAALAARGHQLYTSQFAIEHTLDALLDVAAVA
jgi:glycosyltransferase involved in cell wall biosynthesis